MNRKLRYSIACISVVLAALGVGALSASAASYFGATVQSATATSTPAYMTAGTATTTLVYNTYTNNSIATATPATSNYSAATGLSLLIQLQGSSTAADLHINYEYSQDGIDWYQDFLPQGGYSTTTQSQIPVLDTTSIFAASTTYDGAASKTNFDNFIINVPIPTKDVRVVLTLTGANAAVFSQLVPTKITP